MSVIINGSDAGSHSAQVHGVLASWLAGWQAGCFYEFTAASNQLGNYAFSYERAFLPLSNQAALTKAFFGPEYTIILNSTS